MIDLAKLGLILDGYKAYFPEYWKDEKYKWEAIKHFQEHWNLDAENFGEMFQEATRKTKNLLASGYAYPRDRILRLAKAEDDAVRQMFRDLFDESQDLAERVKRFQETADALQRKHDDGTRHDHYQNTNVISTYLWLMYPDKYYIYKFELVNDVATELCADYRPKRNGSVESMLVGFALYDEINEVLCKDEEFVAMIQGALDASCYPDPQLKTATGDVGFYVSRFFKVEKKVSHVPLQGEAGPAIWKISHGSENTGISDEIKKRIMERNVVVVNSATKAKATSKVSQGQAFMEAIKQGDYFYLCYGNSVQLLGQFTGEIAVENPEIRNGWYEREYRVIARTNNNTSYTGTKKWWTPNDNSTCIKVDKSEHEAFESLILQPYFHMSIETLFAHADEPKRYWWLTANPKIWRFSDGKVGEEQNYTLYNENGNRRRIFQNFLDVKAGDIVVGYESNPIKKIVALAEITKANDGSNIYFTKTEGLCVFNMGGNQIGAKTLDLNKEFKLIAVQLDAIAEYFFGGEHV